MLQILQVFVVFPKQGLLNLLRSQRPYVRFFYRFKRAIAHGILYPSGPNINLNMEPVNLTFLQPHGAFVNSVISCQRGQIRPSSGWVSVGLGKEEGRVG